MDGFPGSYGILFAELRMVQCHSLKMKRGVVKRLIGQIQKQYNASVVELDYQDKWQRALLGVGILGHNRTQVEQSLRNVEDYIEDNLDGELVSSRINVL